jgi:small basic protein (TIGR04137 family)
MSLDRSLKMKASLSRHRNVLSRAERIEAMKEQERWEDGRSALGLPKISHRKAKAGKKKVKEEAAATATPGAAPAPAAGAKAPAKPAK